MQDRILVPVRLIFAIVMMVMPAGLRAETRQIAQSERRVGVLTVSHGELAFASCGAAARSAVDATPGRVLSAQLDWLLSGHDGGIRVEAEVAADEEGWSLTHLRRAGHLQPTCPSIDSIDYVWAATGHGVWRMVATPRSVSVSGLEGLENRRFRYAPFARDAEGGYRYVADAGNEKLVIELLPALCRSSAEPSRDAEVSEYRALLTWRGRQWAGCAHNGHAGRLQAVEKQPAGRARDGSRRGSITASD
jgi:hypothetical protein